MATTKASEVGHHGAELEHQSVPHIIPGVLYPAVGGNDIHGTDIDTSHGSTYTYGTAHTDGRKYYYTDIKGSKPIKDPRIGGHFGSQRHKFKSLQLLEQETATHGKNVYSIDGREWCRAVDGTGIWSVDNSDNGNGLVAGNDCTDIFLEITGYFNNLNMIVATLSDAADDIDVKVNGSLSDGVEASTTIGGKTTVSGPLGSRYVDRGSVINVGWSVTTPQIITIRYEITDTGTEWFYCYGIELIAQDTTSTANRSKIQIPSQDVVSYGKKFTVSGTPHYNPFAQSQTGADVTINSSTTNTAKLADGWSGTGATYYSSELDTATSLGLSAWESGGDFFRPVNGGRVVWWVNSSGSLKCSVNMMPPAGTAVGGITGGHNVPTGTHNWATKYQPALHSTTIDDSQAEVAKTFHVREFGNGGANAGTGGANYADASMISGEDDVAFVMDDGITSFSGDKVEGTDDNIRFNQANKSMYFTFIGTGVGIERSAASTQSGNDQFSYTVDGVTLITYNSTNSAHPKILTLAQNLPYGTHILKISVGTASNWGTNWRWFTFHQPKKPPIPEDACVLADYMLMADFVPQTTAGNAFISKGVRKQNITRDVFFDETDDDNFSLSQYASQTSDGFSIYVSGNADSDTSAKMRIPSFGTNYVQRGYQSDTRTKLFIGDTDNDSNATKDNTASYGSYAHLTSDLTLGVHQFGANAVSGQNGNTTSFDIVTPIHTSSHYQTFETPFLHELVGGDRNMEQHNLVVSPDGKTWDQITRDTSYIGNLLLNASRDGGDISSTAFYIFDILRGVPTGNPTPFFTKDFAIAYDKFICLVEGHYKVQANVASNSADSSGIVDLKLNGDTIQKGEGDPGANRRMHGIVDINLFLKRGDYLQYRVLDGTMEGNEVDYNYFSITRI